MIGRCRCGFDMPGTCPGPAYCPMCQDEPEDEERHPSDPEIVAAIDALRRIVDGATNSNHTAEALAVQLHRHIKEHL